jgi:4-hydroxybenzoate polyprenyltransferase
VAISRRLAARAVAEGLAEVPRPAIQPNIILRWIAAIRLYQWVKNILIFVPAMMSHAILKPEVFLTCVAAFVAFGLCASSVYIINDLFDLAADRAHPRKRFRPFAAGTLSLRSGVVAAILLVAGSAGLALSIGWEFAGVLGGYYVMTWAYSVRLKQAALVDVITLAGLYTLRIIAGATANQIAPSFWLLAFSVFIFLSLGFVKRYEELDTARKTGRFVGSERGYFEADLALIVNLGIAAAYSAVVVVALYVNSADSQLLYRHSRLLWLICPLLLYWISRVWLLATRGHMHDDPIVFALKDWRSLTVFALLVIIVAAST